MGKIEDFLRVGLGVEVESYDLYKILFDNLSIIHGNYLADYEDTSTGSFEALTDLVITVR